MNKWLSAGRGPLLALATIFALIVLHESGHILAGWLTGGRVTDVRIVSTTPSVQIAGSASDQTNAFRALAGSGIVLTAAIVGVFSLPRAGQWSMIREVSTFFAGIELLGWFVSAVAHPFQAQSNDAGKFLQLTGTSPWMVASVCFAIAASAYGLLVASDRGKRSWPWRGLARQASGTVHRRYSFLWRVRTAPGMTIPASIPAARQP